MKPEIVGALNLLVSILTMLQLSEALNCSIINGRPIYCDRAQKKEERQMEVMRKHERRNFWILDDAKYGSKLDSVYQLRSN